ncbi:MAG TPA: hypothetical protein GXZ64_00255, partial [Clostridiaceae bacterium]|nr:hypothetical protein [Clostridiaceae bacterium]
TGLSATAFVFQITEALLHVQNHLVTVFSILFDQNVVCINQWFLNSQNVDQTTTEALYVLLLPLILKKGKYGFYKKHLVHYYFFDNLENADYLLQDQADKPRYLPEKTEFLKYADESFADDSDWHNFVDFMFETFGCGQNTIRAIRQMSAQLENGAPLGDVMSILADNDCIFEEDSQIQDILDLIMSLVNNARRWENKGHTPTELMEIVSNRELSEPLFLQHNQHVGRNDPCLCGSKKKYKRCCALIEDAGTAQLTETECRQFYKVWLGLLGYVNDRGNVLDVKIGPDNPNGATTAMMLKVRNALWDTPSLIDDYLKDAALMPEEADIVRGWKRRQEIKMGIVLEYKPEYAVILVAGEKDEDSRLYGIKGLSDALSAMLRQSLPVSIEMNILPFKDKIVYDGFIQALPVEYGPNMKAMFRDLHDVAIQHGIITSLT